MQNTIWNIRLIASPFHSNLEIAGELVIKLHVPYSKDMVTIKINPNITEYQDNKGGNIRQLSISKDTDETKTLQFDSKNNNIHKIKIGNDNYEIRLMNMGKVNEQGQDFPTFEFLVKRL